MSICYLMVANHASNRSVRSLEITHSQCILSLFLRCSSVKLAQTPEASWEILREKGTNNFKVHTFLLDVHV